MRFFARAKNLDARARNGAHHKAMILNLSACCLRENAARRPTTVYGASKLAGEGLLAAYAAEHGVDGVALRVSSTYGPGRTSSW